MNRSKRFYQKKLVKVKQIRRIYEDMSAYERSGSRYGRRYPGTRMDYFWMRWSLPFSYNSCPKSWNKHYHIRPARVRSNQYEHLVEMGRDPDSLQWPNYRKPHIYYW
jgi:hypothetical protein